MKKTELKWLGSRQRDVMALFKDNQVITKRMIQDACPSWAAIDFFLDRTILRLESKGLIKFRKFRGYTLSVRRNSAFWQTFIRRV